MKKTYFYLIMCALFFPVLGMNAQDITTPDNVRIEQVQLNKEGNTVKIDMTINLDNVRLGSSQMYIFTPVLRSADLSKFHRFQPIVIMGAGRSRTIDRAIDFEGFKFEEQPQMMVRRYNKRPQSIPVTLTTQYQDWIRGGDLILQETKSGCAYTTIGDTEYKLLSPAMKPLVVPVYEFTYVTPPVEEVKQRSETHTARINFEVGKYTILRNFKNNAEVFADVDKVVNELRNDNNLTVNEFHITGYASPEGNEQSNMKLSENRAKAFVSYLAERYSIPASSIRTDWKGEDWDGLRKVVQESNLSNKSEILNVLDEPNVAQRKNKLKQLNGGQTYRTLLNDYYPPLRRNEYTIAFVAKKFSVDEAKAQIQTKPQYLSLNEMFLVANTYPKTSREFKEVFDIAARMYPDSPVAQQNTAALELENGSVDNAISRLQNINMPEAWNNLGVAYAKKGDYTRAMDYFKRAANAGNNAAKGNSDQLQLWLDAQ